MNLNKKNIRPIMVASGILMLGYSFVTWNDYSITVTLINCLILIFAIILLKKFIVIQKESG